MLQQFSRSQKCVPYYSGLTCSRSFAFLSSFSSVCTPPPSNRLLPSQPLRWYSWSETRTCSWHPNKRSFPLSQVVCWRSDTPSALRPLPRFWTDQTRTARGRGWPNGCRCGGTFSASSCPRLRGTFGWFGEQEEGGRAWRMIAAPPRLACVIRCRYSTL